MHGESPYGEIRMRRHKQCTYMLQPALLLCALLPSTYPQHNLQSAAVHMCTCTHSMHACYADHRLSDTAEYHNMLLVLSMCNFTVPEKIILQSKVF